MATSPNKTDIVQAGSVRQEFGATQTTALVETSATAVAAKAKAMIEAQYIVAMNKPRDLLDVRDKILHECDRPSFAGVAVYSKPIGGSRVEGPSIRFAEALRRCMTNMATPVETVYDDEEKRLVNVCVIDLENNNSESKTVTIAKTLLRKNATGYEVIGQKTNTRGERLYVVRAEDDDLLNKENSLISKAKRNAILSLCPGDIIDEAIAKCRKMLADKVKEDPDAERKAIADGFSELNIPPSSLKQFLGCELGQLQPAELIELRKLYIALRDGEVTWREVINQGKPKEEQDEPEKATTGSSLRDRVQAATRKQTEEPKQEQKPEPTKEAPKQTAEPPKTEKPQGAMFTEQQISEEEMRRQTAEADARKTTNAKKGNWKL